MSEQELARLCAEGDKEAQALLYTMYAGRLLTLCRRYCRVSEDAHDLMQDALLKSMERISDFTFRGSGSLYAWLRRIAVNMAVSRLRKNRFRFVSLEGTAAEDMSDDIAAEEVMSIPKEKMLEMISSLPQMKRTVFNMYCIDGYSHKEISGLLGISEKGSASCLAKARKSLKAMVVEYLKING